MDISKKKYSLKMDSLLWLGHKIATMFLETLKKYVFIYTSVTKGTLYFFVLGETYASGNVLM